MFPVYHSASAVLRTALVCSFSLSVVSCSAGERTLLLTGPTMGTTYHAKIRTPAWGYFERTDREREVQDAINLALEDVNSKMSTYQESSELSELNRAGAAEPVHVSADTFAVFNLARRISEESGGAFDVTVGPLVNAWGFGPGNQINQQAPDEPAIAAMLETVGYTKLELNAGSQTIAKQNAKTYCDLSAIAKGFAVDKAALALDALGIENYMVEVGGEVRAKGTNDSGQPWQIAIERPTSLPEQQVELVVPLANLSMATSGDYRNFEVIDGQRYSHTINPKTGRPIAHKLASVSVITKECAEADGYATAIMALGPEAGLELANRLNLAVYMIIHGEGETYTTQASDAFQPYLDAPQ